MSGFVHLALVPALWAGSAAGTGIIGWYVKAFLDRAKPDIKVASIEIDNRIFDDKYVVMSSGVLSTYSSIPLRVPDFDERMRLNQVKEAIDYIGLSEKQVANAIVVLDQAIDAIDVLSADTEKKIIRERVLRKLSQEAIINIESVMASAVMESDFLNDIKRVGATQDYTKHPSLLELNTFGLNDFRTEKWNLAELLESDLKDQGPHSRFRAVVSNIIKRVLIYCEKPVLQHLLELTASQLSKDNTGLKTLMDGLVQLFDDNNPSRVWVEVVISNRGKTPEIFDGSSFLDIKTATGTFSLTLIPSEKREISPIVVKAGDSQVVLLKSEQPIELASIKKRDEAGGRKSVASDVKAKSLVETTTHKFSVSLVRISRGGNGREIRSDDFIRRG